MTSAAALVAELWARLKPDDGLIETKLSPEHDSLTAFKKAVEPRYLDARHTLLLDSYLQQVTRYVETVGKEGIGRLIVAMPPRNSKTLTVSQLFSAWHLGRNPSHRIMNVSHSQGLANKNSRYVRNLIRGPEYHAIFPHTTLAQDSRSVMAWDVAGTSGEGGMYALGVFGPATGKGAHILIADDLLKGRKTAESILQRNTIWDAFINDLMTRLAPGGAIILMATRWHEDDPTGRALKMGGWTVLNLPALAVENDILGRAVGEPLWPERFPLPALLKIKEDSGEYTWNSLYQQDPHPPEGGHIKRAWFSPYVRTLPELVRSVRYWDLAMSSKTGADYTVGLKMSLGKDGKHYITDIVRAQVELAMLPTLLIDTMLADGPDVHQGLESAGYMTRAIQDVAKDRRLAKHVIKGYPVHADKLTRVLPFAARAQLELIRLMDARWTDGYVGELAGFPYGEHDDQVDASSGAWLMINEEPRKTREATTSSWI